MSLPGQTDFLIFCIAYAAIMLSVWIGDRLTKK